ncbi:SPASM domain-containing protein [Sphingomonas pituitosa]|uniref:SPASM domain-containing protein n=1 Tax=Sphingomonas pituitosa TaxID=99597 RepID=UPI000A0367C3|nr:SPASM domain-containing protein [Sphingomonas pituitosa]
MSYLPGGAEQQQEQAAATAIEPGESRFYPILSNLVDRLRDELDHPEVWPLLADACQHDDIVELRDLVEVLEPEQNRVVRKVLNVVGGVLHALSVDRNRGLTFLRELLAQSPHCALTAGAIFFVERFGTDKSADLSTRFCEFPFIKFETLMDGTVAPCCSIWTQQRLGHLEGQAFEQIWNSPSAQAMRESILDGSYRYCNKQRCTFINEDALPLKADVTDPMLRAAIDENRTHVAEAPRWLFLAHDVTCNLACPSCRGGIEVADEAQERRFEIIEQKVFQPMLNAEGRTRISISGQGDPWSSPHYRSILRYLADNALDVELHIHSNALLMGEKRWEQYQGLDHYRPLVDVSIDACTPWVYDVVRRPGKWDKLLPNLEFIAAKRAVGEFCEFHLNATVQLDNYHEMPALIALAKRLQADTMRMYMMQNTGGHLAPTFTRKNVGDPAHPLYTAFLETLRHPVLGDPVAHLYDVASLRTLAFETMLPSDALGADYSREALREAIRDAGADPARRVALCAAGRVRFPVDIELLQVEAASLREMGFVEQAGYRLAEATALGGEAIAAA